MQPRIGIIGGGFSGAATAIHLSRKSPVPLDISVIEPSPEMGRGVAYGTTDPDHRINGPTTTHSLHPDDAGHFDRWCRASGALADDPDCIDPLGRAFVRRAVMGRYVGDELASHQAHSPSDSTIRHIRDRAVSVRWENVVFVASLADGSDLEVDMLVVATSNAPPAIPPAFAHLAAAGHPAFYPDPWDLARVAKIADGARILIVGTGLTMADVAVSVLRDHPGARITAISRRGLLPKGQRQTLPAETIHAALARAVPAFVARHGHPASVRAILRALREDVRANEAQGIDWQAAFDDLREAVHQLWPRLPLEEQSRFLRHLAPWYETHRFRYPPQTETMVKAFLADGRLTTRAATLVSAEAWQDNIAVATRARGQYALSEENFDAVINCTGPDRRPDRRGDPFLHNLASAGLAVPHSLGLGLTVDELCRARNGAGGYDGRVRVIGPLARGCLGEITGVPHTAFHIARILPDMLAELETVAAAP